MAPACGPGTAGRFPGGSLGARAEQGAGERLVLGVHLRQHIGAKSMNAITRRGANDFPQEPPAESAILPLVEAMRSLGLTTISIF